MKLYGLIGKTLTHSFSRSYFTDKFIAAGISHECNYVNFELESIDNFKTFIQSQPLLTGLNVTIPYKEQIISVLDGLSGIAAEIGAVNTIKIERNEEGSIIRLTGFNTDVTGFLHSIKPLLQKHHTGALVLGTGGASKAVIRALIELGISYLQVSRSQTKSNIVYHDINREMIENFPVIINTTPVGTFPKIEAAPAIPYEYLSKNNFLYDLVYNPAETLFMKKGILQGATVCNGLSMLKIQAEESWKIWNTP